MTPELTRREFLAGGAAAVAGLGLGGYRSSNGFQGTLHVLGIGAGEFDEIARLAKRDLGFDVAFDITGSDAVVQRAITTPASFDVLAHYYHAYDLTWRHGALQPIDTRMITRWTQVDGSSSTARPGPATRAARTARATRPSAACTSTTRADTRRRRACFLE
jgi:hypothetical protein